MKLQLVTFPSSRFSWSGRELCAEASDMGNRHLQPLYDDACDVGFAVISDATGEVVEYTLVGTINDQEGELKSWKYMPTIESCRRVPACRGTTATIFND